MKDHSTQHTNMVLTDITNRVNQTPKEKLSLLRGLIKSQTAELNRLARDTVEAAVLLGEMLAAARGLAKHGTWQTWVEKNCEFTPRYANDLIRLSQYFQGLEPANRKLTSDLTVTAAIAMAKQKPDFATFDADQFAANLDDSQADEPEDEPAIHPAPEEKKPEPTIPEPTAKPEQKANAQPAEPEPVTKPLSRGPVTIEGEYRVDSSDCEHKPIPVMCARRYELAATLNRLSKMLEKDYFSDPVSRNAVDGVLMAIKKAVIELSAPEVEQ